MDFDVEKFISAIEARPAIWDMTSPQYTDRYLKVKQWEEIVMMYLQPGQTSYHDKKELGRILQNKWKNFRDAFMKECRRKAKLSAQGATATEYRYYNKLKFLKPFAGKHRGYNKFLIDDDNTGNGSDDSEDEVPLKKRKKSGKSERSEPEQEANQTNQVNQMNQMNHEIRIVGTQHEEDPDRQFMLSLVPDLRRVPDSLKPVVKINIIKCILKTIPDNENYD